MTTLTCDTMAQDAFAPDLNDAGAEPDATRLPTVTALCLSYNGGERTYNTVAALTRQRYPLHEILLVDNGSTDGSLEPIRRDFPQVRIISQENLGLPAARNAGLRHATGDLVFMVDGDVYAEPDCLERLVEAHLSSGCAVVCPRIRLIPERDTVQCDGAAAHFTGNMILRHAYQPADQTPATPAIVDGCIGASSLVDRRKVIDAGGWDEAIFLYFEDHEFCTRMRGLGHRFYCEPRALVYHDRVTTSGLTFRGKGHYPARRAFLNIRDRWNTILTNYRLRTLIVLLPAMLVYEAACLGIVAVRGWWGPWFKAVGWHLSHAGQTLRRRRAVQKRRVVPDRELLVGGPLPFTPGFVRSRWMRIGVSALSWGLNAYWRVAKPLIG